MSQVATETTWLIDERQPIDQAAERQIERSLGMVTRGVTRGAGEVPSTALLIHDVIVHDVRKWFGKADVRLDALVVHGYGQENDASSFYAPQTFRFSRIGDESELQIGEGGLLLFHGRPLHFLDIFITLSRDTKDSDDLATLLKKKLGSEELKGALGSLVGLAVAAPQVAAVTAAVGAAAVLGDFTYRVIRQVSGSTIGLYRNTWLQYRDEFGVGRHPGDNSYRMDDFSFWYEILLEQEAEQKAKAAEERQARKP
jgi:hypothetical protein